MTDHLRDTPITHPDNQPLGLEVILQRTTGDLKKGQHNGEKTKEQGGGTRRVDMQVSRYFGWCVAMPKGE